MVDLSAVYAHIDQRLDRYLAEVSEFCAIPSVGGDAAAMAAAQAWLVAAFGRMGCTVESLPAAEAHPYVLAEVGAGARSVLFFNHYDVADYTNPIREVAGERRAHLLAQRLGQRDEPVGELRGRDAELGDRGGGGDVGQRVLAREQDR